MLLKRIEEYEHIYVACGYTDMRKGINGLAYIAQRQFELDPFGNSLFLFCGRRRRYFKALSWEGNGFALYYRRFDGKGASLRWPMTEEQVKAVSLQQLTMLLEGFSIVPSKGFGEVKARSFY